MTIISTEPPSDYIYWLSDVLTSIEECFGTPTKMLIVSMDDNDTQIDFMNCTNQDILGMLEQVKLEVYKREFQTDTWEDEYDEDDEYGDTQTI